MRLGRSLRTIVQGAASVAVLFFLLGADLAHGASFKLASGETLASLAEKVYGSRHYQLPLAKLNKVDPKTLPPGVEIRAPDLKSMVMNEGLAKELEGQVDRVINARYQFMRVRADLIKAMEAGAVQRPAQVPIDVQRALREAADELEDAGKVMAKMGVYAESSVRVRQRLSACSQNLRLLAAGSRDAKLEEGVHRLLAQTFVRLLSWARLEDG